MKLARLKQLQQLSASMHPYEVKNLTELLQNFEPSRKGKTPAALEFWELLQGNDGVESLQQEVLTQFGPENSKRLARRWQKVFSHNLLLDHNLEVEDAYSEIARQRMRIEQQLLFVQILASRDLFEEALDHLRELETDAHTYFLYDSLVQIMTMKQELLEQVGAFEEIEQCFADADFYELCSAANVRAKKAYYKAIQNYGFKAHSHSSTNLDRLALLAADLKVLEEDYATTKSALVNYYFHYLKVEHLQLQQQFGEATKYCLALLDVIRGNPSVYHSRRMGIAYLNLSQNELFNHYFDYALGFAKQGQDYFQQGSRNRELGLEMEFYAYFYAGKTRTSGEVLDQLLAIQNRGKTDGERDFRTSWRAYLRACVHFVMGDFREVHRTLHDATQINRDKEGWNLGMRVLTVMNLLELNLKDHADAEIDNLKNFARRSLAGAPIRQRDRVIIELFSALKKHNYDFEAVVAQQHTLLQRLASKQHALAWKVQTPELIAVHKWFEAKALNRLYRPDYSQEALFS
jgi:hypothetical protein